MTTDALPTREDLKSWRDEGRFEKVGGHTIFVHASGKSLSSSRGVLLTHGNTGSSIDWKPVGAPAQATSDFVSRGDLRIVASDNLLITTNGVGHDH